MRLTPLNLAKSSRSMLNILGTHLGSHPHSVLWEGSLQHRDNQSLVLCSAVYFISAKF